MTTQEYISRQRAKLEKLKTGVAVGIAAQDTHVKMVERIFDDGKKASGGKERYNSTDEIYVNPKNSPKNFPLKGKNGTKTVKAFNVSTKKSTRVSVTKGNTERKTGYFKSYKAFRAKIGRQTKFVDLVLFGNLVNDFSKGVIKLSDMSYVSKVTKEENVDKVDKFSAYFKLNKAEKKHYKEVLEFETINILR